jgi:hypothetical protein
VERHLKIQSFVPEEFWSLSCELETPDRDERGGVLRTNFHWERHRLYDRLACLLLFEMCVETGTGLCGLSWLYVEVVCHRYYRSARIMFNLCYVYTCMYVLSHFSGGDGEPG